MHVGGHDSVLIEDIAKKNFPRQQLVRGKERVAVIVKKKRLAAQEAWSEKRRGRPSYRDEEEEEKANKVFSPPHAAFSHNCRFLDAAGGRINRGLHHIGAIER